MLARHFLGDVMLAFIIAVPSGALLQPEPMPQRHDSALPVPERQSAALLATAADRQVGLYR